jgi:hypothetical protein
LIDRDITAYNERVTAYNTLVTSYDALKTTYNAKLKLSNVNNNSLESLFSAAPKIDVPDRPTPPTPVAAYTGFSWGSNDEATTTSPSQVLID